MADIGGALIGRTIPGPSMHKPSYTTVSGVPVNAVYTAADVRGIDSESEIGQPGHFPFTRGIHEAMYRRRLWTMRQSPASARPPNPNHGFAICWGKARPA